MKKLFFILTILLVPLGLFAAGSGGGGGGNAEGFVGQSISSSCTKSTWACTEWSSCNNEGKRERICTKTFDCPSDTTKPSEEEICEAPKKDLPPVRTHWCYTLPLLKQRVECRLGLSEKDLEEEYARQYLPEECRAIRNKKQHAECVTRYKALQPCWEEPIGDERIACAKDVVGFPENLAEERRLCAALPRAKRLACLSTLRQKIYHLVKFRFYDLNERAEDFLHDNATVDGRPAIQFIVSSEVNKQRFNNARNKQVRLQIIKNERAAWQRLAKALSFTDKRDFLDAAMKELAAVE